MAVSKGAQGTFELGRVPSRTTVMGGVFSIFVRSGSLAGASRCLLRRHIAAEQNGSFAHFTVQTVLAGPMCVVTSRSTCRCLIGGRISLCSRGYRFSNIRNVVTCGHASRRPNGTAGPGPVSR